MDADGLGLAGPQVGMMRRIFICLDDRNRPEDAPADYKDTFIEFINPEIEYLSDETVELYEGCLSFPGPQRRYYPLQKGQGQSAGPQWQLV